MPRAHARTTAHRPPPPHVACRPPPITCHPPPAAHITRPLSVKGANIATGSGHATAASAGGARGWLGRRTKVRATVASLCWHGTGRCSCCGAQHYCHVATQAGVVPSRRARRRRFYSYYDSSLLPPRRRHRPLPLQRRTQSARVKRKAKRHVAQPKSADCLLFVHCGASFKLRQCLGQRQVETRVSLRFLDINSAALRRR